MNMAKGIIYIMTTSVEGLIKIGKTQQFENRMNILEQNGYWNVSGLHRFYAVEVDDYDEKEKLIHTVFNKSQVASSELFALDKNLAKEMLDAFEGNTIYPKNNNDDKIKSSKAPRLTFEMLDIPIGSTLVFEDMKTEVTTVDMKSTVKLDDTVCKISKMVNIIKNDNIPYQGGFHFYYKGKRLTDIRAEKGV